MRRDRSWLALVVTIGAAQLVAWGVSYYLIGVFGDAMAADLGWSRTRIYAGFSVALLSMGLASPLVGRLTNGEHYWRVMSGGAAVLAASCLALAVARHAPLYYAAWACMGLGMRATLYDAAFAALVKHVGPDSGRAMAAVTICGGLASSVFWPLGGFLAERLSWRGALIVYAACAAGTIPLHLSLRRRPVRPNAAGSDTLPGGRRLRPRATDRRLAGALYGTGVAVVSVLNAAMSSHMVTLLSATGLSLSATLLVASLRGAGQSSARLAQLVAGRRVDAFRLNLVAAALLPLAFGALLPAAGAAPAILFTYSFGAGNGLATISRGTLPLALFDAADYGTEMGKWLAPSFVLSALAPSAFAMLIDTSGTRPALLVCLALSIAELAVAVALQWRFGPRRRGRANSARAAIM